MDGVNFVIPIPEGCERDPVAIRRPAGAQVITTIRELDQPCPIDVDHIDIVILRRSGVECQSRPIRRPGAASAHIRQIGNLSNIRTIPVHHVQLTLPCPCRSERDHHAIW